MNQGKIFKIDLLRQICNFIVLNYSYSKITSYLKVSKSTVQKFRHKLINANILSTSSMVSLSDSDLASVIYGDKCIIKVKKNTPKIHLKKSSLESRSNLFIPDFLDYALRYSKDNCLYKKDLFFEYIQKAKLLNKDHMKSTAFMKRLNYAIKSIGGPKVYMHREHNYGEDLQLDWCGDKVLVLNDKGQVSEYFVLVLTWAASYYTFAVLVKDLSTKSTVDALRQGLSFFNVYPKQLVVDNPKCMVYRHNLGQEAIVSDSFNYFLKRTGIMLNANNPRKSNEKSAVEHAVKLIEKRILPNMDSLNNFNDSNKKLQDLVKDLINNAPFRDEDEITREKLFLDYEKNMAVKILTYVPEYIQRRENVRVSPNYHICYQKNFYSVPFRLTGKTVDYDIVNSMIIVYRNGDFICQHQLSEGSACYITDESHMPQSHRFVNHLENIYKTADDILDVAKLLSIEVLSFCTLLLLRTGEFPEMKKACIYIINSYKKLQEDNERILFNNALNNILKREELRKLNTYMIDKELKIMRIMSGC